jgi:hypothetical protein
MTSPVHRSHAEAGQHVLAGLEFSTGAVLVILGILALYAFIALAYISFFIGALVSSAQHLYESRQLRHRLPVVLAPLVAAALAYTTWNQQPLGIGFATAGLTVGYAVMFAAGRNWFRWTALAVFPTLLLTVLSYQ